MGESELTRENKKQVESATVFGIPHLDEWWITDTPNTLTITDAVERSIDIGKKR